MRSHLCTVAMEHGTVIRAIERGHAMHDDQPKRMAAAVDEVVVLVRTGVVRMVARRQAWGIAWVICGGVDGVS